MAGMVPYVRRGRDLVPTGFEDFYNLMDDFFTPRSFERATFRMDVREDEKEYVIEAELPGVKKEEVGLDMNDGRLTISVRREETEEDNAKNYLHKERRISSMSRAVSLPDTDPEGIKAKLDNGVLCVAVPKRNKQASAKKIDIE
ncbi:MAG: Hsp20/alpha crystallin family protein [Firmicutes bacterium]|nr:Hsp20/alpha crystallin family protein [Bacillota bacterium]